LPYKKILPKELYKDLLNTFLSLLDPGSKPNDKSKPRITQGTEVVALESSHNKGFYISHQDYLGLMRQISETDLVSDFIFKLVTGLDGLGISFESINFPGFYLRHQGYRIKLHKNDNSPLFKLYSTFTVIPGIITLSFCLIL
jgi:hypothetical protein